MLSLGSLLDRAWRFAWPTLCHACGNIITDRREHFPRFDLLCARCRSRLGPSEGNRVLLGELPLFCAFAPDQVLFTLVKGWKYGGRDAPCRLFVSAMADRLALERLPSGVTLVPVPLPLPRRIRRGFNQSELLARGLIHKRDNLRLGRWLERSPLAGRQAGRRREQRLEYAVREYHIKRGCNVEGPVVLVDDICTSGATLRVCRDVLETAGAEVLGALVLARVEAFR
ncbi:MAG: ComF family protein [bacterium]|nr:ComF family protein [bacterium]